MRVAISETLGRAVDRLAVLQVKASKLETVIFGEVTAEASKWKMAIITALDEGSLEVFKSAEALGDELKLIHRNLWDAEERRDWQAVRVLNVARRELITAFDRRHCDFAEPYTLGKGGDNAN